MYFNLKLLRWLSFHVDDPEIYRQLKKKIKKSILCVVFNVSFIPPSANLSHRRFLRFLCVKKFPKAPEYS